MIKWWVPKGVSQLLPGSTLAASLPCFSGQLHESTILLSFNAFSKYLLNIDYIPETILFSKGQGNTDAVW